MSRKSRLKCTAKRKKKKPIQAGFEWAVQIQELEPGEIPDYKNPMQGKNIQEFTIRT
ncbi:MAG: hypothetical protein JW904_07740 [Spirochaetales bacterium]|nr:hypothetical protein [Spirochaetales bacterium]